MNDYKSQQQRSGVFFRVILSVLFNNLSSMLDENFGKDFVKKVMPSATPEAGAVGELYRQKRAEDFKATGENAEMLSKEQTDLLERHRSALLVAVENAGGSGKDMSEAINSMDLKSIDPD